MSSIDNEDLTGKKNIHNEKEEGEKNPEQDDKILNLEYIDLEMEK